MRSADGESISRLENIGCMNYLIADTTAPPYADQEPDPAMPVTWRLIWNDDRYLDNVIPGEEVEYLAAFNGAHVAILRCAAGQNCLREGYWFTPARNNSRRHFNAGEVMPDVGGDYGSTIWQWDAKQ